MSRNYVAMRMRQIGNMQDAGGGPLVDAKERGDSPRSRQRPRQVVTKVESDNDTYKNEASIEGVAFDASTRTERRCGRAPNQA